MIGILIPVHNEEQLLDLCLETIKHAAAHPALKASGWRCWWFSTVAPIARLTSHVRTA